jgi:oligosaccharide repeat unit polymerase
MTVPIWFNPIFIMTAWFGVAVIAYLLPESVYIDLMRTPKYIDGKTLVIIWFSLSSFIVGAIIGIIVKKNNRNQIKGITKFYLSLNMIHTKIVVTSLCFLCVSAYTIWLGPTFSMDIFLEVINSSGGAIGRQYGNLITGVTTLTQIGIPLVVVCSFSLLVPNLVSYRSKRFYWIIIFVIFTLSLYRVIIWSERLSFFELTVPLITVWVYSRFRGQLFIQFLPLFFIGVIIVVFGFFEYFRSWNYYQDYYSNIFLFSTHRLCSYYVSSFNNMAMLLYTMPPAFEPINTLDFIYKFPNPFTDVLREAKSDIWKYGYIYYLERYTNPEFNLFSGVGFAVHDFGPLGGSMALSVYGFISGLLYKAFKHQYLYGLILYPIWMTGLLDFGRILYWTSGRAFPSWVAAFLLIIWISHSARLNVVSLSTVVSKC